MDDEVEQLNQIVELNLFSENNNVEAPFPPRNIIIKIGNFGKKAASIPAKMLLNKVTGSESEGVKEKTAVMFSYYSKLQKKQPRKIIIRILTMNAGRIETPGGFECYIRKFQKSE